MPNFNRPASLVARVTVMVGFVTVLCLIILGGFVQQSIKQHFIEQETEELEVIYDAIVSVLEVESSGGNSLTEYGELESAVSGHHGVFYLVENNQGEIIYETPGPDLGAIADRISPMGEISSRGLYDWIDNENNFSGVVLSTHPKPETSKLEPHTVVIAVAMDEHLDFLSNFNMSLWSIIAGISLLSIVTAWVAARQAHSPLHELSSRIRSITSDKLDERLDETGVPSELDELVTSFNAMIKRIEGVFEKLSNFSADIAHELRTPITNLITQTQVSLGKARSIDEYRELLYSNLEEYERLARTVSDMLYLARTENGLITPKFEALDVNFKISQLLEFFEPLADEKQLRFNVEGHCSLVNGDSEILGRAISNIISNAIHHSVPNSVITVSLRDEGQNAVIEVANTGKTISADDLPNIFERFYQVDKSRKDSGVGLGLAIVKSSIELLNGTVSASSDEMGTRFSLILPLNQE